MNDSRNKYSFATLDVDSGEESDEERLPEPTPQLTARCALTRTGWHKGLNFFSIAPEPVKLTKTAMKKAAKAARLEKQKKTKHLTQADSAETDSPAASSPPDSPPGSIANPVKVLDEESQRPPTLESQPPAESETQSIVAEQSDDLKEAAPAPSFSLAEPEKVHRQPDPNPPVKTVDAEKAKKRQNVMTRTLWTFIMIGGFIGMFFRTAFLS